MIPGEIEWLRQLDHEKLVQLCVDIDKRRNDFWRENLLLKESLNASKENRMRVNVYAEEMSNKVEIIKKEIDGNTFTGLRLYLYLPVTKDGVQHQGPFMHHPGDDDSSAVTFWGKRDLRPVLQKMINMLDDHYGCPVESDG